MSDRGTYSVGHPNSVNFDKSLFSEIGVQAHLKTAWITSAILKTVAVGNRNMLTIFMGLVQISVCALKAVTFSRGFPARDPCFD